MAKFMHSLMCDYEVKFAQAVVPIWFQETAFYKLDAAATFPQTLSGELVHGR